MCTVAKIHQNILELETLIVCDSSFQTKEGIINGRQFEKLAMNDFVQMEGGVFKTGDNQLQEECGQRFHNKTGIQKKTPCIGKE